MKKSILGLILTLTLIAPAAHAYIVDGDLSDWGVAPGAWGSSDWTPNSGITFTEEDQYPSNYYGYLNPGYGGQAFDAEAMYATEDADNFYFAIVTGYNPAGVNALGQNTKPGDIFFDLDVNGTFDYAIRTVTDPVRMAGGLYSVNTYGLGSWNTVDPTVITSDNGLVGTGNLVYNDLFYGTEQAGKHFVIEGSLSKDILESWKNKEFAMQWTQTCGNDVIRQNFVVTPEPASVLLFGLGGGFALLRRRQIK